MNILRKITTYLTPQKEPATPEQVPNSAGGYTFEVDDKARLRRFLTLGVDGGTYYSSARALALENVEILTRMAHEDPNTLVDTIVDVSTSGTSPRVDPALFSLAYACSVPEAAQVALAALPKVARTGSHLLSFAAYARQFRGWGRGLRRGVGHWYTSKDADALAYQVIKYRSRNGWTHRDLLRVSHPKTSVPELRETFAWLVSGTPGAEVPDLIRGFTAAQQATDPKALASLIREYRLSWEMLPTEALNEVAVWDALLDVGVPQTALLRQLPRLTRLGMLPEIGGRTDQVVTQLVDPDRLKKARVHPVNVLIAQRTYARGRSVRGSSTWTPTTRVVDALDRAFYAAFGAVEPANRRTMLALDVSGSMCSTISDMPLSAREASAALALVQMATEPQVTTVGFTAPGWDFSRTGLEPLPISPRQRLDDALAVIDGLPFGNTDCALPMVHATRTGLEIDTFVIYTDNETWAGNIHPYQALREYRRASGIPARLIVVAMTATSFSIADPTDAGMLDVAGFDAAVPQLISNFSAGI